MAISSETRYFWTCDLCNLSNRSSGYKYTTLAAIEKSLQDHLKNVCAMRVDLGTHLRHTSTLQEGHVVERKYSDFGNGYELMVKLENSAGDFSAWHYFDECELAQ